MQGDSGNPIAGTAWEYLASNQLAIASGLIMVGLLFWKDRHKAENGVFAHARLVQAFGIGAAAYTFAILFMAGMVFETPTVSEVIHHGFGDQRIGWLVSAIVIDSALRIYHELFWPEVK